MRDTILALAICLVLSSVTNIVLSIVLYNICQNDDSSES